MAEKIELLLFSLVAAGAATTLATGIEGAALLQTALVFAIGLLLHRVLGAERQGMAQGLPQLEALQDLLGNMAVVGATLLLALRWLEVPG